MNELSVTEPYQRRRRFSREFKAGIVAQCQEPGASVSRISLDNGLNANMVRRWISEAHRADKVPSKTSGFVPVNLPAASSASGNQSASNKRSTIRIEIPRSCGGVASGAGTPMFCPVAGPAGMIRIDEIWLATEPLDMRAGPDKALARVIQVFGSAKPHCAYLFTNKRGNRMKVLIHDGLGIWLCARRLNRGKFHWGESWRGDQLRLTEEQLSALVQGLPWQRLGADGVISIL